MIEPVQMLKLLAQIVQLEPIQMRLDKFPAKMIATQDRTFLPIKVLVLLVLKDNFKIKITNQVATSVL